MLGLGTNDLAFQQLLKILKVTMKATVKDINYLCNHLFNKWSYTTVLGC